METRPFGKTGINFPILSLGCQRLVDDEGCSEDQAVAILNTALERGIRYFDTAWSYSRGESERRVGLVAKHRRDEMWIATKTSDPTADGALRQLEESLRRLQTDHIDEWRLHGVNDWVRLDVITGRGGALEALTKAREEGTVRYLSISGHSDPQIQVQALHRFPFDTALVAVSPLDHFVHSFAEEFLPIAQQRGVGVIGMKVMGKGVLSDVADRALRYAFALPLTTVILGCSTMAQLDADLKVAEDFKPMGAEERLAFFREILPLVSPQNVPWKAVDWGKVNAWKAREDPAGLLWW